MIEQLFDGFRASRVSGSCFDDCDVAPDSEHFLVLGRSGGEEGVTLQVVTGWFEELRAITRERYWSRSSDRRPPRDEQRRRMERIRGDGQWLFREDSLRRDDGRDDRRSKSS